MGGFLHAEEGGTSTEERLAIPSLPLQPEKVQAKSQVYPFHLIV